MTNYITKRKEFDLLKKRTFFNKQINKILEKQNHRCFYCKELFCDIFEVGNRYKNNTSVPKDIRDLPSQIFHLDKYTIDHVIPLSKNGTNEISNLRLACLICNCKKHNKII